MNAVTVLCWSTGVKKALPVERKGPLTWVETRGTPDLLLANSRLSHVWCRWTRVRRIWRV